MIGYIIYKAFKWRDVKAL